MLYLSMNYAIRYIFLLASREVCGTPALEGNHFVDIEWWWNVDYGTKLKHVDIPLED